MKNYSVAFATDKNYIQPLSVALVSLLINNDDCQFDIYIICSGMGEENFVKLQSIGNKYQATIKQIIVNDEVFDTLVTNYHFTKATYYRLMIPNFIQEDKVLYLDADIVVNGSVKKLFSIDLEGRYIAAVLNPGFKRHQELKMNFDAEYFNAGVMLINNKLWKSDDLAKNIIEFIDLKSNIVQFADQDGLNAIIDGNGVKIPLKFNQQSVIF